MKIETADIVKPWIGCIADDFTGASDAASFLNAGGARTLLFNGIPADGPIVRGFDAVVIALKTRNTSKDIAIRECLEALKWLHRNGIKQFYFKYCSTFDSTPQGNIGPVIDSILEYLDIPYTILCPALPVNRRIVSNGELIVDGCPLAQGHMRFHPLNPMWASRLSELMKPQGKYPCLELSAETLHAPEQTVRRQICQYAKTAQHFYIVPDYASDDQGMRIAELFGDDLFLTGGSGLLQCLALRRHAKADRREKLMVGTSGRAILLSGSCSTATRAQIDAYAKTHLAVALYPEKLLSGEQTVEKLFVSAQAIEGEAPLFYAVAPVKSAALSTADDALREKHAKILEKAIAALAKLAYENGFTRFITAGGETSGAVAIALGLNAFSVGPSIASGVPMMSPISMPDIRLVLKSGNFGQNDFFERALSITGDDVA